MCPSSVTSVAAWLCVFVAIVYAQTQSQLYKKVGDDVVLQPDPGSFTGSVTSIIWKLEPDLVVDWEDIQPNVTYYRNFKGRSSLNTTTGAWTIRGLSRNDSATYTPYINNNKGSGIRLIIISAVPVPTVTKSCDADVTSCILTCEGETTRVELVEYRWKTDVGELETSSKKYQILKNDSLGIKDFRCELINPVSRETSGPVANPFSNNRSDSSSEGNLKINTGLTVFICLLSLVLVLVFLHRCKAGMWFFQKESMPWESDFWSKSNDQPTVAGESNGSANRQEKGQGDDEETPLN